jgi:hypothetical protein
VSQEIVVEIEKMVRLLKGLASSLEHVLELARAESVK